MSPYKKPPRVSDADRAATAREKQQQLKDDFYERQAAQKRKRKSARLQPRAVGSTKRLQS